MTPDAPAPTSAARLAKLASDRSPGKATRDAYGDTLVSLGAQDERIVALDADLASSTRSGKFGKAYPDRFFNFGICEANMVGAAAGLASAGKIPFASSFASFLMCKSFDQLRMAVANPRLNAKFVGSHGGISIGEDGASQMSVEDLALACTLAGFAVVCPADEVAAASLTRHLVAHVGPVYMRTGRPKAPRIYDASEDFPIGGSKRVREGSDVTLVASGLLVDACLAAAERLSTSGVQARVVDAYSIKPIDEAEIAAAARETQGIVVCEEHMVMGGLGGRVAETVARHHPARIEFVGMNDAYAESGTPESLFEKYGFTAEAIASRAAAFVKTL